MTTITTTGAGAVGILTNTLLIEGLLERAPEQQAHFKLIDPAQKTTPYDASDDIAWLNQPANRMSASTKDIEEFTNFLRQSDPHANGDSFASRRQYGLYLADKLKALKARIEGTPLTLEEICASAIDADYQDGRFITACNNGQQITTDHLITPTGHQLLGNFNGFTNIDGFFQPQFQQEQIKEALAATAQYASLPIAIIGTSQSFVDALAHQLESDAGSQIHAFSGRNILPWKFDPKAHPIGSDNAPYDFRHLTSLNVSQAQSCDELKALLAQEFENAAQQGIGPGIVLSRMQIKEFFADVAKAPSETQTALAEFANYFASYYGNMTPPQRYDLIQSLLKSGQLQTVQQRLTEQDITHDDQTGLFTIGNQQYRAVYNGAAYARTAINPQTNEAYSPFLQQLHAKRWLKLSEDGRFFSAGQQNRPGLWLPAGPATEEKWGMETFRAKNIPVAHQIIAQIAGPA